MYLKNTSEKYSGENKFETIHIIADKIVSERNLKNIKTELYIYGTMTENSDEWCIFEDCVFCKFEEIAVSTDLIMSQCSLLDIDTAKLILTHLINYTGTDEESTHSILFYSNVWDLLNAYGETSPDGTTGRFM